MLIVSDLDLSPAVERSSVMAKKQPPVQKGQPESNLKAEVQAFASGLGLASGSSNGFHDADFRPKARKQLPNPQAQKAQDPKPTGKPSRQGATKHTGNQPAGRKQQQPQVQQNGNRPTQRMRIPGGGGQNQLPNVKERQWNEGVGTRPGMCLASMQFPAS